MAKNTSISLGEHFDVFIANQVESGRFGSASEVIRAALRQFEMTETKIQALRKALDDGEKSGIAEYSYDAFMDEIDHEIDG